MLTGMSLNRVRVVWDNFPGKPGYSNHYFDSAATPPLAALSTFYNAVKGFLLLGMTIQIPNSGDVINEADGKIVNAWTGPSQTLITCSGGNVSTGATGMVVLWRTSTPVRGRRPIGKTFLVPTSTANYDTGSSPLDTAITTTLNAALSFVTAAAGSLQVWHRPTYVKGPDGKPVKPPVIEFPGSAVTVIGATVPDFSAVLRSRRR